MRDIDKYRGCLIGGAAGDALGYAVEFYAEGRIFGKYGEAGMTEYELTDGVAKISDDTQMTLFTANGLLLAADSVGEKDEYEAAEAGDMAAGENDESAGKNSVEAGDAADASVAWVARAYSDWLMTQTLHYVDARKKNTMHTWLADVPELYDLRAPGKTCLSTLNSNRIGTIEDPINDSKGCGGVMRVAPVGLYFEDGANPSIADASRAEIAASAGTTPLRICQDPDMIGARVAAITHGHEMGYIPAATLTHIIRKIVHEDATIEEAVASALEAAETMFNDAGSLTAYLDLMNRAVALSREELDDLDAIHELGEGWIGDEALAIAVYCALKYPEDIDKALIAAVNHGGDSDSTGAIAGNIVGASVGLDRIPDKYKDNLELYDVIIKVADDLYND